MNADLLRALDRRLEIMRGFNEGKLTVDGQLFQLCRDALAKQDQGSVVKDSLTADGFDVHKFIATVNAPDLAQFARLLFAESEWPEGGDIDGHCFQEAAVECGLLVETVMHAPCGENCHCNDTNAPTETEWEAGQKCYRKAAFLMEGK